ncbi:MAG: ABC transporter permease subunit [Firmicutes bacterium]|nr:ABC transporter permease subunit [Bacillota bacterium]
MKFFAVVGREFQEHVRNYKLVLLLMVIFGGILMALYTEVGPTANSTNVLDPFFELFAVLCPIIGIFAAMDAVVGEKEKGTLELILSKPISRSTLLYGKFVNYLIIILPLLVAELTGAYFWSQASGLSSERWHLAMPPFSQWMAMVAILTAVAMYYTALTIFISLFAKSTAVAGLVGILFMTPAHPVGGEFLRQAGIFLGIDSFTQVPMPFKFGLSIFSKYQKFALTSTTDWAICVFSLLAITVFILFVSGQIFERQNVTFRL